MTSSPMPRWKPVSPGGPSIVASSRLAAALSLIVITASHSVAMLASRPTYPSVTGEWLMMSEAFTGRRVEVFFALVHLRPGSPPPIEI